MKKLFLGSVLFLCFQAKSQQIVINDKLLTQLTKDHAVRLASEETFLSSYKKQKKLYDEINNKTSQIIAIQESIYQNLKNINSAIKQSKKLYYLYQYLGKIVKNSKRMLKLSSEHPEYAILVNEYYEAIGVQTIKLEQELVTDIMREDKDFLMDAKDREMLIDNLFVRVRNINGNILYINMRLDNAKNIPYLYQVPVLRNYISIDKLLVTKIMTDWKNNF